MKPSKQVVKQVKVHYSTLKRAHQHFTMYVYMCCSRYILALHGHLQCILHWNCWKAFRPIKMWVCC